MNAMLAGQRTGAIFMPPAVAFFFFRVKHMCPTKMSETNVSNKNGKKKSLEVQS